MTDLAGICVPVCTPFSNDGARLDEVALLGHLDAMLAAGVHIIALCGGTGEFPFLSEAEKRRVIELGCGHIDGRAKVVAQTSAIRTEDSIEASKHAEGAGADCLLVLPPYFEGPDADGVLWHYERVAASVSCEVMAYNIPQYTDFDVTPELFSRIRNASGNVTCIKDSTGDMLRLELLVATGARVFNGSDYLNLYGLVAGCAGCFSGSGNAMPAQLVELYDLVMAGKLEAAAALWERLRPASVFFCTHAFNPAIKAATEMVGRPLGECRLPVQPLEPAERAALAEIMAAI